MTGKSWLKPALLGVALVAAWAAQGAEKLDSTGVNTLPASPDYRLYVSDPTFPHMVDGRLHVIDGDTMKYLGMIATGFSSGAVLAPDRSEIYVATTYYARLNHGERTDVVDIHDARTLAWKGEIVIPPHHAQATPARYLMQTSADGRYLFVQNATPATSVTVVDLKERKVLNEVATPGCWAIYPALGESLRFSALCGNGAALTVSLDAAGQVTGQRRSAPFFNPDQDPLFTAADRVGDQYYFVSFHGAVQRVDFSGAEAVPGETWSLLDAKDRKAGWRPGGYQLLAVQPGATPGSGRLYVGMHDKGEEGSHKNAAKEVWVFDLATHQRLARLPGHHAMAMTLSRGPVPRLFLLDEAHSGVVSYDVGGKPRLLKTLKGIGDTPMHLEVN